LRLIKFLVRELVFSIIKVLTYRNLFYIMEFPKIYEGYKLYKFVKPHLKRWLKLFNSSLIDSRKCR
jgi:hypothetical protein